MHGKNTNEAPLRHTVKIATPGFIGMFKDFVLGSAMCQWQRQQNKDENMLRPKNHITQHGCCNRGRQVLPELPVDESAIEIDGRKCLAYLSESKIYPGTTGMPLAINTMFPAGLRIAFHE